MTTILNYCTPRRRLRTVRTLRRLSVWLLLPGCCIASIQAATDLSSPESMSLRVGWELQEAGKVSESGEALSRTDFQPVGWFRATVPGTVLTTLVDNRVYPDPLYGENNRPDKIPDTLCRTSYWYRTTFTPPASYAGKQIWLTFEGINYVADVFVNGHQLGTIKGAFIRGIFDVTSLVTVAGP